jgi:hypothetical protein
VDRLAQRLSRPEPEYRQHFLASYSGALSA